MRRGRVALIPILGLVAVTACTKGTTTEDAHPSAADGEPWTILHYSIADTDLEPFMVQDVNEMGTVGSNEDLNIVALVDRAAGYGNDPLLDVGGYVGAKLLHIRQGSATVLEEIGDLNTGDPQVLADFIANGFTDFPGGHTALIISDHGASWPGVGGDESAGYDSLDLVELEDAIATGLGSAGVDKLDLLGFDACLMATYEVASTLAPYADRLVASQELEPGHGWNYGSLQLLVDEPGASVDTFGAALVEGFAEQATANGTESAITLSLIDLTKMEALDAALADFGGALTERAADVAPIVGRTRASTLGFGRSPDPFEDTHMTDLGLLASQIGVEALDVSDQADAVMRALGDAVLYSVDGQATTGATGLSIYFPPEDAYFQPAYEDVVTDGDWNSFLASYYGAGDDIPRSERPRFTNPREEAEVFFDEDGLNIVGTFDLAAQDNLAEATITYGIVGDDGSVTYIGEEPAAVAQDGSGTALGIYDMTALTISDGEDTSYAYLALTIDEESGVATIDVPMAYYDPEDVNGETYQDVLLELILETETTELISETYYAYDDDLGTYGELFAKPRGIIVPEALTIAANGTESWDATSDIGLYANLPDLAYDLEDLPTGTELYATLTVTDFGGNSDSVSAQVAVP